MACHSAIPKIQTAKAYADGISERIACGKPLTLLNKSAICIDVDSRF
jgi:hypothetical protein